MAAEGLHDDQQAGGGDDRGSDRQRVALEVTCVAGAGNVDRGRVDVSICDERRQFGDESVHVGAGNEIDVRDVPGHDRVAAARFHERPVGEKQQLSVRVRFEVLLHPYDARDRDRAGGRRIARVDVAALERLQRQQMQIDLLADPQTGALTRLLAQRDLTRAGRVPPADQPGRGDIPPVVAATDQRGALRPRTQRGRGGEYHLQLDQRLHARVGLEPAAQLAVERRLPEDPNLRDLGGGAIAVDGCRRPPCAGHTCQHRRARERDQNGGDRERRPTATQFGACPQPWTRAHAHSPRNVRAGSSRAVRCPTTVPSAPTISSAAAGTTTNVAHGIDTRSSAPTPSATCFQISRPTMTPSGSPTRIAAEAVSSPCHRTVDASCVRVNPSDVATARSWRRRRLATRSEWTTPPRPSTPNAIARSRGTDPISLKLATREGGDVGVHPSSASRSRTPSSTSPRRRYAPSIAGSSVIWSRPRPSGVTKNALSVSSPSESLPMPLTTKLCRTRSPRSISIRSPRSTSSSLAKDSPSTTSSAVRAALPRSMNGPIDPTIGSSEPGDARLAFSGPATANMLPSTRTLIANASIGSLAVAAITASSSSGGSDISRSQSAANARGVRSTSSAETSISATATAPLTAKASPATAPTAASRARSRPGSVARLAPSATVGRVTMTQARVSAPDRASRRRTVRPTVKCAAPSASANVTSTTTSAPPTTAMASNRSPGWITARRARPLGKSGESATAPTAAPSAPVIATGARITIHDRTTSPRVAPSAESALLPLRSAPIWRAIACATTSAAARPPMTAAMRSAPTSSPTAASTRALSTAPVGS